MKGFGSKPTEIAWHYRIGRWAEQILVDKYLKVEQVAGFWDVKRPNPLPHNHSAMAASVTMVSPKPLNADHWLPDFSTF